jgi:AraC-like DNA-binding protein
MLSSTSPGVLAAAVSHGPRQSFDGEILSKLIVTASASLDSDPATAKDCIQRAADLLQALRPERLPAHASSPSGDPNEAARGDPSSRLLVQQAIDLLCMQLIRGHSSLGALHTSAPRRGLADWQVKRVTTYMRDHLDQEIGLQELATLVNRSRFHFCTAFRMATGHTPHEWLTVQRIQRGKVLLTNPTLSITEIALTVGYQTPSAFAATFRKIAGVTPTEFRRAL